MASSIQLLRSNNPEERPFPGNLLDGQPAINTNEQEPGLFFKASDNSIVKVGPPAITSDGNPPNANGTGQPGNTIGELWLDKSLPIPVLKVYDGVQWVDAGSGGGGSPGIVTLQRWVKTAAGGETSLSGPDNTTQILSYTPGLEEVFLNGVLLTRDVDYFASSGTSITSLSPLTAGDEVTVLGWTPFNILGAIDGSNLIDESVSEAKISAEAVTALKLAPGSITDSKVSVTAAISSEKLQFTPRGNSAVNRTLQDKLREFVSVKDFGAVGDGITDDYPAFLAATDFCNTNAIRSLLIPPGNYHLSEPWRAPAGGSYVLCKTIGDGAVLTNTVIALGGSGIQGLTVAGSPDCGFCFLRGQGSYHSYLVARNNGSYGFYFGIASRQHITVNSTVGFQVGETVIGGTSGAFGTVERIDGQVLRLVKCNMGSSAVLFSAFETVTGSTSSSVASVLSRSNPYGSNYQVTRTTFDQVSAVGNASNGFYWDGSALANRSWMNATCWTSPSAVGNAGIGWEVGDFLGPNGSNQHNYNTYLNINCEGNGVKSLVDVTGRQNTYIGGHFVDTDGGGESVNVADSFNFQLGGRFLGTVTFNGLMSVRNMATGASAGFLRGIDNLESKALRITSSSPPTLSTSPGEAGEIRWDSNYVYVCTSTNSWKRTLLSSW
jgi:hypothetical protein